MKHYINFLMIVNFCTLVVFVLYREQGGMW